MWNNHVTNLNCVDGVPTLYHTTCQECDNDSVKGNEMMTTVCITYMPMYTHIHLPHAYRIQYIAARAWCYPKYVHYKTDHIIVLTLNFLRACCNKHVANINNKKWQRIRITWNKWWRRAVIPRSASRTLLSRPYIWNRQTLTSIIIKQIEIPSFYVSSTSLSWLHTTVHITNYSNITVTSMFIPQ